MYNSPIDIIYGDMTKQIDDDIYRVVPINVDKEELLLALQYDRGQYKKGYADGKADAFRWIPVAEMLPEKETNVLAFRKRGKENIVELDFIKPNGEWYGDWFGNSVPVLYWYPVPLLPEV